MRNKTTKTRKICAALAALFLLSTGTYSMAGIFGSVTLFSEVSGTVATSGKPLAGAKLVQIAGSVHDEFTAETTTDENGKFVFPALTRDKGILSLFPKLTEFVVSQAIIIHFEGKEYRGWASTKRSSEPGSEHGGTIFELACDLDSDEEIRDSASDQGYRGVCQIVTDTDSQ